MRPAVLITALLLAACARPAPAGLSPASPGSRTVTVGAELDELAAQIARVSAIHRAADDRLVRAVSAVRRLDGAVGRLRDPDTVDDAVAAWSGVDDALAAVEVDGLRAGLLELATAVDGARVTLAGVRPRFPRGWEARYLDAEDRLLAALREYAAAADRLAQTLQHHWPVYAELRDRSATFVSQRGRYRTDREAADAYEVAVSPLLDDLAAAHAAVAQAGQTRDAAAHVVNNRADAAERVAAELPG